MVVIAVVRASVFGLRCPPILASKQSKRCRMDGALGLYDVLPLADRVLKSLFEKTDIFTLLRLDWQMARVSKLSWSCYARSSLHGIERTRNAW
ncbi:hypothetical protein V6N11_049822 [Hibiscus sabdariffa]|uniref:Uncharacterized protein n=2 Tax=Hibiscus sabdariffa TaxID=183260 RepID=A0ABR2T8H5_9ROSI